MPKNDDRKYFKWGLTALCVIFISILLVVIFTNLPGFFSMIHALTGILSPLIIGVVIAFLLNPLANFVDFRLRPFLLRRKMKPEKAEKLSRIASLLFALVLGALIVYAFFAMLVPQLYESVMGIVANAQTYYESIERWVTNILEDNPEILSYVERALDAGFEFIKNWLTTSFLSDVQKVVSTLTT